MNKCNSCFNKDLDTGLCRLSHSHCDNCADYVKVVDMNPLAIFFAIVGFGTVLAAIIFLFLNVFI